MIKSGIDGARCWPRSARRRRDQNLSTQRRCLLNSETGRTADRRGNGVSVLRPDDLEEVVFGICQVRGSSVEELSVDWLLGDAGTGATHLVGQFVHGLGGIDGDANAETDASRTEVGLASPVRSQLREGEEGEDDAS